MIRINLRAIVRSIYIRFPLKGGLAFLILLACVNTHAAQSPSVAFYYAEHPPVEELAHFDRVVLQPHQTSTVELQQLHQMGAEVFAYISIGEMSRSHYLANKVSQDWVVGENSDWNSWVMDLTHEQWRTALRQRIKAFVDRGFDGVFLDTLDSFQLVYKGPQAAEQQQALASLIVRFSQDSSDLKILLNRGFDLLPEVHQHVHGVVVESLFSTWHSADDGYGAAAANATEWLTNKLMAIHRDYPLPIYVIDYVDPADIERAAVIADQIKALGFIPWVAGRDLNSMGVGQVRLMPRRILAVYNSTDAELQFSNLTRYLSPITDYLGYRLDYVDVNSPLPVGSLNGLYAGVISWMSQIDPAKRTLYHAWLSQQVNAQVPVLFIGNSTLDNSELATRIGLSTHQRNPTGELKITKQDPVIGQFEAPVRLLRRGLSQLHSQSGDNQALLSITDSTDRQFDPVIIGPWGGVVTDPYVHENGLERKRWFVDPFAIIKKSLKLKAFPVPDVTTENGQRVLITHIDGDGFLNRADLAGSPYSSQVIRDQFLSVYPINTTVSVIVAELIREGLAGEESPAAEAMARTIFKMDNVEVASHTYSHPFFWDSFNTGKVKKGSLYGDHIPIKGYNKLDLRKEIEGSVDYINTTLTPPGKQVEVFLWSGDAAPTTEAVAMTAALGLRNLNGGNTTLTNGKSSLSNMTGGVVPMDGNLQVLAPFMNENDFTNLWTGPFYGFEKVIEAFQLSEKPRRLKPLNIYYHFYSGEKMAGRAALRKVYDWALRQDPVSIFASEYVDRASAAYFSSIAQAGTNHWQIRSKGPLRTVRFAKSLGYPDVAASTNVAGFNTINGEHYVHLTDSRAEVVTSEHRTQATYLLRSNGIIKQWQHQTNSTIRLSLRASQPLFFEINSRGECRFDSNGQSISGIKKSDIWRFAFKASSVAGVLSCAP